ncbi:hypothetical protein GUITHDRAFT_106739 [Guillardia theta CCMP2712]|uniref:USP domain-containing protein n=1 Tax=Guillardia theta (strain CCMP2712) TaxID=905079 RepID=L1JGP5_GUITC|nr:hypothetical protein GUITHDRAFT_106739 [Guillardia theta CCMP2712]EKX47289.1 hypothetical protein GUITHDRAFT_106739 [Guillardia theta CCMP2712]|eukprot:XP_005834269.1 hypothetical protein GUITHDRAFT_106739 [Guillardia theta CCMP2712]
MSGGRLRLKRRGEEKPCRDEKRQASEATPACCSFAARETLPPIGLLNAGNTCYVNVIVQMLRHVRPLRRLLLGMSPEDMKSSVLLALQQQLRDMDEAATAMAPTQVLASLQTEYGISGGAQQDAHELFLHFLDDLPQRTCFGLCQSTLHAAKNASWCPPNRRKVEVLGGADKYACPRCNTMVEAARWTSFSPPYPPYLMIHLTQPGLATNIQTTLSHEVLIGSERQDPTRRYELLAVILRSHLSEALGHYTVICRSSSGWNHFDDSNVSALCGLHVQKFLQPMERSRDSFTAYMLLYGALDGKEGEQLTP